MKFKLLSIIAVGALFFTACTDDSDYDNLNKASGVTVEMKQSTFSARENSSFINVPIEVKGDANGSVIVYVETAPTAGEEPAVADENYIVTSDRIIIPAGETVGYVEIRPLDNTEENDNRFFDVKIVKVEGAQVGAQNVTIVELRDNDKDPYEKMTGTWIMNCVSEFNSGADGPFTLTIETPDPDEEAEYYGYELYGYGLKGYDYVYMTFNFNYNEATDEVTMSIQTGSFATLSIINFGFNGVVVGSSVYNPGVTNFGLDIPLDITVENGQVVAFAPAPTAEYFLAVVPYPQLAPLSGYWDGWTNMSFERK